MQKKSITTTQKGNIAEGMVAAYLQNQGYRVVQQNVHTHHGEIDIIAKQGNEYVCVEVRSQKNERWLATELTFTHNKYRKIVQSILSLPWLHNRTVRIDFITVIGNCVAKHYKDVRWEDVSPTHKLEYSLL